MQAHIETESPIRINGQNYLVIRKVKEGDWGVRDLTLFFLNRPVEGINIRPILPLAEGQTIPNNSLLHAISFVSSNVMLGRRINQGSSLGAPANDTVHALPFGLHMPHYGALNSRVLRDNFNLLSVNDNGESPSRFIPTEGDSGSPYFASMHDNSLATVGILSTIGENHGTVASYTYIGRHLDWINQIIQRHYAAENANDFAIQVVDANNCNFNAASLHFGSVRQRVKHLIENDPAVKINQFEQLQNELPSLKEALKNDPDNIDKRWIVHHTEQTILQIQQPVYYAIEKMFLLFKPHVMRITKS